MPGGMGVQVHFELTVTYSNQTKIQYLTGYQSPIQSSGILWSNTSQIPSRGQHEETFGRTYPGTDTDSL